MTAQEPTLNVHDTQSRSAVNGPGERFVLWLQGCPLACPGCFSPETHSFQPRHVISVREMADRILSTTGIEGVTYSGGEPMAQAGPLALLTERLREAGFTVVCYTGYTLDALRARNDPSVERLLTGVDILIDGPFLQERGGAFLWRGSGNQRVHFLTDAYRHLQPQLRDGNFQVEFTIREEGFDATGIWPEGFWHRLTEILKRD